MYNGKITRYDKMECTEWMLDILEVSLKNDGPFSTAHGLWIQRARVEIAKQRAQYLETEHRTPGGEL